MKILVFGDIHGRRFWKPTAEKYLNKVDKIIFLGDYCDPYLDENTEPPDWKNVLNNFLEIIELKRNNPDKVVLLLGNHDEHYRSTEFAKLAKSTRYDPVHSQQLYDLFNGENYKLFKICHEEFVDGKRIIFSHAGITNYWLERYKINNNDNLVDEINSLEETSMGLNKLAAIGKYRTWFGEKSGSPLWCDIREFITNERPKEFYQIFGHTRLRVGFRASEKDFSCVDSQMGFIIGDKFRIRKTKYEKVKTN